MKIALPWLLAALSGLVLALAMPGPGLGPLALLFPFLLLEALERGEGKWRPWLLGWLAGTVFWTVSTNWVVPVMHHYGGLPQTGGDRLPGRHGRVSRPLVGDRGRDFLAGSDRRENLAVSGGVGRGHGVAAVPALRIHLDRTGRRLCRLAMVDGVTVGVGRYRTRMVRGRPELRGLGSVSVRHAPECWQRP